MTRATAVRGGARSSPNCKARTFQVQQLRVGNVISCFAGCAGSALDGDKKRKGKSGRTQGWQPAPALAGGGMVKTYQTSLQEWRAVPGIFVLQTTRASRCQTFLASSSCQSPSVSSTIQAEAQLRVPSPAEDPLPHSFSAVSSTSSPRRVHPGRVADTR